MLATTIEALAKLKTWLLCREYDIGNSIEDFGELKEVFEELIGRKASNA